MCLPSGRRARRPGSRQIEISKAGRPPVRPPIQISTKLSSAGCRARRPGRFEIIRILIFLGGGPFETQFKTNGCFMIRKNVDFQVGSGWVRAGSEIQYFRHCSVGSEVNRTLPYILCCRETNSFCTRKCQETSLCRFPCADPCADIFRISECRHLSQSPCACPCACLVDVF